MYIVGALLAAVAGPLSATGDEPDVDRILESIDELTNFSGRDFTAVYTLVSEKPGEERSVTQARIFRRDENDQFLLLILQPQVNRGQGYLQVDDVVWFYDPESRSFEQSTLKENVQDSDARNSDLAESNLSDQYRVIDWEPGRLGAYDVWILDLEAISGDADYDRRRVWVRQDVDILLMQEDYSVNDRLMRTLVFQRYATVDNAFVPSVVLILDNVNEGNRTQFTLSDPSVAEIPDYVFTKAYLERVNE